MKLKPYPKYKDSRIQWIGEIPEGWEVKRIKDYLKFQIGGTPSTSRDDYFEGDNIWVTIADMNKKDLIKDTEAKISDEAKIRSNVKKVPKGSLLFSFKLSVGYTAFAGCDLFTNEAIASFLPNQKLDLNFLKYVLQKDFENNGFENIYGAKLFNTDLLGFARYVLPPDIQEQQKIASFLDKKNSEIDKTIRKDKQLIELLKEKRIALINHAVTKGLDSNAKMKDSGIDWIGKIPEGWKVDRLKFLVSKINSGITPKGGSTVYTNEGIPLLRSQNIHFDGLRLDDVAHIPEEIHQTMLNSVVKKRDVLINITGASIGRCTHVEEEFEKANVNQHVCIIRPKDIFYKYLSYYLISRLGQDQVFSVQMGTSREGVNFEQLGNFIIFHPNKELQQKIVHHLDQQTSKIVKTIQKIEKKIEFLEEYKKSLIHYVITGKIDVRSVAA